MIHEHLKGRQFAGGLTVLELSKMSIKICFLYYDAPTVQASISPRFPFALTHKGIKEYGDILGCRLVWVNMKGDHIFCPTPTHDDTHIIKEVYQSISEDMWCLTPDPDLPCDKKKKIGDLMDDLVFHRPYSTMFEKEETHE